MTIEDAVAMYVKEVIKEGDEWYTWKIPKKLPEGITVSGESEHEKNLNLKTKLHEYFVKSCDEDKIEISNWYISEWGGIRNNKKANIRAYACCNPEKLIGKGKTGIASWSKALCIKPPSEYAIYDARVACALNCLQILYKTDVKQMFPSLPSRNNKIIMANEMIKRISSQEEYQQISTQVFCRQYVKFLHDVADKAIIDFTTVEMILFAKAVCIFEKILYELAKDFRSALAKELSSSSPFGGRYPSGCCGTACDLLAKYLEQNGIITTYSCIRHSCMA